MEYQYPLDLDWSNDEMVEVIKFFNQIENYYEKSIIGTELKSILIEKILVNIKIANSISIF